MDVARDLPQELGDLAAADSAFAERLNPLLAYSSYALRVLETEGAWVRSQWLGDGLEQPLDIRALQVQLSLHAPAAELVELPDTDFMHSLRRLRHRALFSILWRDFSGEDPVAHTLAGLSETARVLIGLAVDRAAGELAKKHGTPRNQEGAAQDLVVLALGKLGGGELNFSSDVDLMFAFGEAGESDGRRALSNEDFFARVVRRTLKLLEAVTELGFVYRVDLRLRPFGDAGRLALSFAATEQYYLREGRDWERYALQKATPIAGNLSLGRELLRSLSPFIYRRYVDYGVFDSLRDIKTLIRESGREQQANLKLGPGGIREIEFLTQAFQLVRGGREATLREPSLIAALRAVGQLGLLPAAEVAELQDAYFLLRRVENRLQQKADQQVHSLPDAPDALRSLAASCGFSGERELGEQLQTVRDRVHQIFSRTFAPAQSAAADQWEWQAWQFRHSETKAIQALAELGYPEPEAASDVLQRFQHHSAVHAAGVRGRALVDQLLPLLLKQVAEVGGRPQLLDSVLKIIAGICRRTAYLALLVEQPQVRERLIWVCGHSRWLTERLSEHAALLDDLIAPAPIEDSADLDRQLQLVLRSAEGDPEQELLALCQFQQREMVTLAMAFLSGSLDALTAGRLLTQLAEGLLGRVLQLTVSELAGRFGSPGPIPFGVIGYGTLGTREMRFDSDLDLVFLTGSLDESAETDGPKPLPVRQYYTRLVRRLISLLTLRTPFGRLYEVDTRLRPNGGAGFLVSTLAAYETYQNKSAWVWEWQALVRARPVSGSREVGREFSRIRHAALARPREVNPLRLDILNMREKMQQEAATAGERFKFRPGARLDIEFLSQYLCLAYAEAHPALLNVVGTPELLRVMASAGLLSDRQADTLVAGYRSSADSELRLSLGAKLEPDASVHEAAVRELWREMME
ncbi:MAG: bifunctional [glutamate--ammonia ligase]-adenylyl-L-tyrosine phosphorylase/[glutamate--ammonia-ligase] adenylyltransferase [Pseudomonadota bacterium]